MKHNANLLAPDTIFRTIDGSLIGKGSGFDPRTGTEAASAAAPTPDTMNGADFTKGNAMTYDITVVVTINTDSTDEAISRIGKSLLGDERVLDLFYENAKEVK